jgi:hypothetical protein
MGRDQGDMAQSRYEAISGEIFGPLWRSRQIAESIGTMTPAERRAAVHNVMAGEIVRVIVKSTIDGGGGTTDIMVLTESVLVGVALACIRLGGDNMALDIMIDGARNRLAEIRLQTTDGNS